MGDAAPPVVPVPSTPDTTFAVSNIVDETWAQWVRSDKSLLLTLYLFLVLMLFHASHDTLDKELISFLKEGAAGAFSGLMVALRGKATGK